MPRASALVDIKHAHKLAEVFARHRPEVVFDAAAYKHVPFMEAHRGDGHAARPARFERAARVGGWGCSADVRPPRRGHQRRQPRAPPRDPGAPGVSGDAPRRPDRADKDQPARELLLPGESKPTAP